MATIASLLVRIGADASSIRNTLNRTARDLQNFARNASRLNTGNVFGNLPANLNQNVTRAVNELNRLRAAHAQTMTDIRRQFAQGLISKGEMFRAGQQANEEFNRGLLAAEGRFGRGRFGQRISAGLLGQLKDVDLSPLADSAQAMRAVGETAQAVGSTLTKFVTVPLVGVGIAASKMAGDFQASMNKAIAFIDDGRQNIDALKKSAIELSQVTPSTPQEIAEGMAVLGQAGLDTQRVLQTLPAVLRLSTIENVSLDQAVQTVVRSMTALGVGMDQAEIFVDKMALASLRGTVNMRELGESFKYAATVAAQSNQPLNDIIALITKLAQGGLPASTGGTSLRNIIQSIADPTPKAKRALEEVAKRINQTGIAVRDAQGKFLPLIAVLDQLNRAGLTATEAIQIFGRRGGPGFATLLQQSIPDIVKLSSELNNAGGTAKRVADQQFSGLNAETKKLSNAFRALAITAGDSGILSFLTALVVRLRQLIQDISKVNPGIFVTIAKFAALAAILGPVLSIVGKITSAIAALRIAIFGLTSAGALAALTPAGIIAAVVAGLGLLAYHFLNVAEKSVRAQQQIDAFKASLTRLSIGELKYSKDFFEGQISRLEEQKRQMEQITAKGDPRKLGVINDVILQQIKDYDEAKNRLNEINTALTRQRAALAGVREELERRQEDERREAQAAKDFEAQMKAMGDQINQAMNAPGFGVDLKKQLTEMVAKIRNVTDSLTLVDAQTRGLEDREEKLAGPLQDAKNLWAQIEELMGKIGVKNIDPKVKEAAERLKGAIEQASKPDPASYTPLITKANDLLAKIDLVKDSTDNVVERNRLLAPLYAELAALQAEIKSRIDDQGGAVSAVEKGYKRLVDAYNRVLRQAPPPDPFRELLPTMNAEVEAFADRYQQAMARLEQAKARADRAGTLAAQAEIDSLNTQATQLADTVQKAIASLDTQATPEQQLAIWRQFLELLRKVGVEFQVISTKSRLLIRQLDQIRDIIGSFGDFIDALGIDSDRLSRAIDGLDQIAGGIQKIAAAKDEMGNFDILAGLPGILGAAAGAANLIGGIFGGDSEHDKLIRENNEALRALKASYDKQLNSLGSQTNIAGQLRKLDFNKLFFFSTTGRNGFGGWDPDASQKEFKRQLKELGLTLEQVEEVARKNNIKIYNDAGVVDNEALKQLIKAIDITSEALRHFSNTIDTASTLLDVKTRLQTGNALTPAQTLSNQFQIFTDSVGEGILKFVAGIDTTTAQGRAQLRAALLSLIAAIERGEIAASDLGKFESADELLAFIDKLAGSMEQLDDAVNASSENIPNGFKLALTRFNALLPERIEDLTAPTIKPNIDPGRTGDTPLVAADAINSTATINTNRMIEAILALRDKLLGEKQGAVADSQATRGAPALESASISLSRAATQLSGVAATTGAVAPGVEQTIKVVAEMFATEAAGILRAIQEQIIAGNSAVTFDEGTREAVAVSRASHQEFNFNFGDVHIDGADKTAREHWREIKQVAREDAMARFGDAKRWGEVP